MTDALRRLIVLCRGDSTRVAPWLEERDPAWLFTCVATITLGCALYGGVVGLWRAPQQALFTAVKMPLLIFLTCGGNALLNGLLAQLLGSGLSFRQTSIAILMSFTIAALILAALTSICSTRAAARRIFWSWLAGNLFLGAQLSWVLRPFIGSPGLPLQFLRDDPMRGNFYESVFRALRHLLF